MQKNLIPKNNTSKNPLRLQLSQCLNHLLEFTSLGIVLINADKLILGLNRQAKEIFGLKHKEFFGKSFTQMFPHEMTKLEGFISSCFSTHDKTLTKVFERPGIKDMSQFLEISCTKISGKKQSPNMMLVVQDISPRVIAEREHEIDHKRVNKMLVEEHKLRTKAQAEIIKRNKIEEELKKSKEQLETIVQSVEDGIIVRDKEGTAIYANQSAAKVLNYPSVSLLLKTPLKEVIKNYEEIDESGKIFPYKRLPIWRVFRGELSPSANILFHDKITGDRRWLTVKTKPIFDKAGQVQFTVNIISDITKRVQEEKQSDMFIGIAGHELRNSLAGIKAFAQILEKRFNEKNESKALLYLKKIDDRTDKLTKIINDLLDITKIRASKLDFFDEVFDLDELLKEIIEELNPTTKQNLIIKGKIKKLIIADKGRLEQVIFNLVSNAIKYSKKGKKIIIQAFIDKNKAKISVQDFGIGIPKEKQHKIFEPYYQVEGVHRERSSGLGLGLYLSKEIIRHYGGNIWVDSVVGKGSTFHFSLPLRPNRKKIG